MIVRNRWWLAGLLGLAAALLPTAATAQIPDEFKNLKVLPEDIDKGELVEIMRGFADALGTRCWGCHVGEEGQPLSEFDFASDEKKDKKIAREMMKMVGQINGIVGKIDTGHAEKVRVGCATCHHGLENPVALEDVLMETYEAKGTGAAIARYRELREKYYGGYAYNFGIGPLSTIAEKLGRSDRMDDALEFQALNAEMHPENSFVHAALGMMYAQAGQKEKGIAALEKSVRLDPDNRWAKQQLERLRN